FHPVPCTVGGPAFPTRRSSDLTYSGRSMRAGTARLGPTSPGTSSSRPSGRIHSCSTVMVTSVSPTQEGAHRERDRMLLLQPLHRSEEHTSELQSRFELVCRLLL